MLAPRLTLSHLQTLKLAEVQRLMETLRPHFRAVGSSSSPDTTRFGFCFVDQSGRVSPVSLASSSLPPLYAVTPDGAIFNGYGNMALKPWTDISLEDVLRLGEQADLQLERQPAPVATPEPEQGWIVDAVDALDRHRTMASLTGRLRTPQGQRKFSLAVQGRDVTEKLTAAWKGIWTEGTLDQSHPLLQGHEFLLDSDPA